jgi:flagellar protein FlgJ
MLKQTNVNGALAADIKDLAKLRQDAKQNSPEALKETAKQFEALLMNMVLKSMRDATPKGGMFETEQSKIFGSMQDQQLSQTMASRGMGLADVLVRQMSNNITAQNASIVQRAQPSSLSIAPHALTPSLNLLKIGDIPAVED